MNEEKGNKLKPELLVQLPLNILGMVVIFYLLRTVLENRLKKSIEHEYSERLEKFKADLSASGKISDRLFTEKLDQYKKYFSLFDQMNYGPQQKMTELLQRYFLEIFQSEEPESLSTQFHVDLISILSGAQNQTMNFKKEISGLKLQASRDLLAIIEDYERELESVLAQIQEIFDNFKAIIQNEPEKLGEFKLSEPQLEDARRLKKVQDKIFWQMRFDLKIDEENELQNQTSKLLQ